MIKICDEKVNVYKIALVYLLYLPIFFMNHQIRNYADDYFKVWEVPSTGQCQRYINLLYPVYRNKA